MKRKSKLSLVRKFGVIFDRYIEDLLIFSGLFFVNYATFTLNETAGYYSLGLSFIGLGVWVYTHPKHERGD